MKLLIIYTALFFSSLSFAATKISQNLSPNGGESEVVLGYLYASQKAGVDTVGEAKLSGYGITGSYYYGMTDEHAFGVTVGYVSSETKMDYISASDVTTTKKGMADVTASYQGTYDGGNVTFFTKASLSLPPEKQKFDRDKNEDNASSGRISPRWEGGLIKANENVAFGARVALKFPFEGDAEQIEGGVTSTSKISGGNELTLGAFVEFANVAHPNIELSYNSTDSKNYKFGSTTLKYLEQKMASLSVSCRFEVSPGLELMPAAQYNRLMNKQDLKIDTYEDYAFGVAGRFVF